MRPVNPPEFIGSRAGNPNGCCSGFGGVIKNDARRAKRLVGFCATHLPVQMPIRKEVGEIPRPTQKERSGLAMMECSSRTLTMSLTRMIWLLKEV
jgi:hypothetical protein